MAQNQTKRKAKSSSTDTSERKKHPDWSALNTREVESQVIELGKQGKTASEIGMILRDQYAVPDVRVATGKTISQILEKNNMTPDVPDDLKHLISRVLSVKKHIEVHKKDYTSLRSLHLTESKIRKLSKYYSSNGRLPDNWKYTSEQAKIKFE